MCESIAHGHDSVKNILFIPYRHYGGLGFGVNGFGVHYFLNAAKAYNDFIKVITD